MPQVTIDGRELKRLGANLRKFAPEVEKQLKVDIRAAGEIVAEEARLVSGWYSSRIPGSIRSSFRGMSAVVSAGGAKAPHAVPFEHDGVPGSFRHPVFGHREVWVDQRAHPFLSPALEATQERAFAQVLVGIEKAMRSAGFR